MEDSLIGDVIGDSLQEAMVNKCDPDSVRPMAYMQYFDSKY
jgi:hypothetical protein